MEQSSSDLLDDEAVLILGNRACQRPRAASE